MLEPRRSSVRSTLNGTISQNDSQQALRARGTLSIPCACASVFSPSRSQGGDSAILTFKANTFEWPFILLQTLCLLVYTTLSLIILGIAALRQDVVTLFNQLAALALGVLMASTCTF